MSHPPKMHMSLKFMVGGREVSREEFAGSFSARIKVVACEKIAASVSRIRCPTHGDVPGAIVSDDAETVQFSHCCAELRALVDAHFKALKNASQSTNSDGELPPPSDS